MKKLRKLSKVDEDNIYHEWKSGKKVKDIINEWGISYRDMKKIYSNNGVVHKRKVHKHTMNDNYFDAIDTEDKAYFLGFIIADGNINNGVLNITQKNPYILYEFKKYTDFSGGIYKHGNRNIHSVNINSTSICESLISMGIKPTKTYTIVYPDIPNHLENHFMRGVFDGDGCISLRTDKRDGSQRGQVNICSGSKDFIYGYYNRLVENAGLSGRNKVRNPKGSKYYVVDWGGLTDVERIYEYLYRDAKIYLPRKKKTFDKVVSITNDKLTYRK